MFRSRHILPVIALVLLSACHKSNTPETAWIDCSAPDPLGFTAACIQSAEESECALFLRNNREAIIQRYRTPSVALALPALCWSDPGDHLTELVPLSLERRVMSTDAWINLARDSQDDRIAMSVLSSLLMAGNDDAVEPFIMRHRAALGPLDDRAKSLLAWSGQPGAIDALIQAIQHTGYPERRFAMQDLADSDSATWQAFLCEYYREIRWPHQILLGTDAPEQSSIRTRLDELRRVRLDVKSSDACEVWL